MQVPVPPVPDTSNLVVLNQGTVLAVAGILSALCGAIGFLMRQLLAVLHNQLRQEQDAHAETKTDRDYWRDFALGMLEPADRALRMAEHEQARTREQTTRAASTAARKRPSP